MEQTASNRNYRLVIRGVARIFPEVYFPNCSHASDFLRLTLSVCEEIISPSLKVAVTSFASSKIGENTVFIWQKLKRRKMANATIFTLTLFHLLFIFNLFFYFSIFRFVSF